MKQEIIVHTIGKGLPKCFEELAVKPLAPAPGPRIIWGVKRRDAASQEPPSLLSVSLDLLYDRCPRDPSMYLCKIQEDWDDTACARCWENYLYHVANGCVNDPYKSDRR